MSKDIQARQQIKKLSAKLNCLTCGSNSAASLLDRIANLENGYIKAANFEIISAAVGSIAAPPGGTFLLDQFEGEVDAIVSKIDGSGTPTWETPRTALGIPIAVSSFDVSGNYTLTGTPTGNIALIYVYKIQRKDFDPDECLGFETLDLTAEEIKTLYESNADTNAFTDSEKTLVGLLTSAGPGTNYLADDGTYKPVSAPDTYEIVAQNLKAYDYTLSYSMGKVATIIYDLGGGMSITKTFSYTGATLDTVVLSGDTPVGINLTKTLTYTGANLTSVVYT